jgi:hypothetical protein
MNTALDVKSSVVYGPDLRTLLNSEHISYGEIHAALKDKGVFIGNSEKTVTVPLLSSTLLTPTSFDKLIDMSIGRDSRPKVKVSSLDLVSASADWIQPLKDKLFSEEFAPVNGNVEFTVLPALVVKSASAVSIPYAICRQDFSKDLIQRELIFEGEIVVERKGSALNLEFVSTHSSKETEAINKRITSLISNVLHGENIVKTDEPTRITFASFSNEERMRFFKRLTDGFPKHLLKGDVNDIEVNLDPDAPALPNEPEISWMSQTVRRVSIDGKHLNEIFLIAKEHYYQYYHLQRMDVTFRFQSGANNGQVRVSFTFSSSSKADDAELTHECVRISYEKSANPDAKKAVQAVLSNSLRSLVDAMYTKMLSER